MDWTNLLQERKARLARLIQLNSPDIIIYHAMKSVMRAQSRVNGRWWYRGSIRNWIISWWKYKVRIKQTMAKWDREDQGES